MTREQSSAVEDQPSPVRVETPLNPRAAVQIEAAHDSLSPKDTITKEVQGSAGLPIRVREHKFPNGKLKSLLEIYKEHRRMLLHEYHHIQCEIDKLEGKGKGKTSRPLPREPN